MFDACMLLASRRSPLGEADGSQGKRQRRQVFSEDLPH